MRRTYYETDNCSYYGFPDSVFLLMVSPENAKSEFSPYELNVPYDAKITWLDEYLQLIATSRGIPEPKKGSMFSNKKLTRTHASKLVSWLIGTDVKVEPTKEAIVHKIAQAFDLLDTQVANIIPHSIDEDVSIKEATYLAICLTEHPLTADKITSNREEQKRLQLNESICIKVNSVEEALLDFEMSQMYLPQWVYFSSDRETLELIDELISEKVKASNYFLTQNLLCKEGVIMEDQWLCYGLIYKGNWTHLIALKSNVQVFDSEYEEMITQWWNEYTYRNEAKTEDEICRSISSFLTKKLHQGNGATVADAIRKSGCKCLGYADSYKFLANAQGIECILVGNQTVKHAWVKVKCNGKWLNSDPDWEDSGLFVFTQYQLLNNEEYKKIGHPLCDIIF